MTMPVQGYGYFQQPVPQSQPQIQQSQTYVINLPTIEDAEKYPVAPGSGVVIKISNSPFILCKTMGFSQFEQPSMKWYKLLEEEPKKTEEVKSLQDQINELRDLIETKMANASKPPVKKSAKEVEND